MKKFIALLLAVIMCLTLAACSGEKTNGSESNVTDNTDYTNELTQLLCAKNVWYGYRHGKGHEEEITFFEDGHFETDGNSFTWQFKTFHKDATVYLANEVFQTNPNYDALRGLYVTDQFLLGYDTDGKLLLYWRDYFCYNERQS